MRPCGQPWRGRSTWRRGRSAFARGIPGRFVAISAVSLSLTVPLALVPNAWYALVQPAGFVGYEIFAGALVWAAAAAAAGEPPSFFESYRRVLERLWFVLGVAVAYFGAVVLLAITVVGIP